MKIGVIILVAAALIVAVLDYRLYSTPEQIYLLRWDSVPTSDQDANVYFMVRNCGRYAKTTGHLWWKQTKVNYGACSDDAATEGARKVTGEFRQAGSTPPVRIWFSFACVSCKQGRRLSSLRIPLGATHEKGASALKLPLDVHLDSEDELQVWYTPRSDPRTSQTIEVPHVE